MIASKHKEQRVCLLVDLQNLYYSARVVHSKKVNFKGLLEAAVNGRKLVRAITYGISTADGMEDKFFDALEKVGFEVKTKDLQIFPGGAKKGDWDVGIAMDAVRMSRSGDVVILASGDGDYIPVVEYIQNTTGSRVEGLAFGESCSGRLIEKLDDFIDLSKNPKKFLL